jgi:hypothetical protein
LLKIDANGVNSGGVTGVKHDYNNSAFTEVAPNSSAKMVLRFIFVTIRARLIDGTRDQSTFEPFLKFPTRL